MKFFKKNISLALIVFCLLGSPTFAADTDTYIFNTKGPTDSVLIDTTYNFVKDLSVTAVKFALLPVEVFIGLLRKSIM